LVEPEDRSDIPRSRWYSYDYLGRVTSDALYSHEVFQWETIITYGGDRVAVTPPSGGTPTTTIYDIHGRTTTMKEHLGTTTGAPSADTTYTYDLASNLATVTDPKGNQWQFTWDLQGNQLTAKDPDRGLTSATYDLVGNLLTATDARGMTIHYAYDALNRATKISTAGGTLLAKTTWDTVMKGLPSSQTTYDNGAQFTNQINSYDPAGRPTQTTTIIPTVPGLIDAQLAGSYTTTYTYNPDGSLASTVLPAVGGLNTETLTYGYTHQGLPDTLTGQISGTSTTYLAETGYYDGIRPSGYTVGPINSTQYTVYIDWYEATLKPMRLSMENPATQVSGGTDLYYDPAGNLTRAYDLWPGYATQNQCFAYDYQQQLVEAWTTTSANCPTPNSQSDINGAAGYWESWTVDTIGRVTDRTDRTPNTTTDISFTHPADGPNSIRPHTITSAVSSGSTSGNSNYTYDASGNMITRPGPSGTQQTLTWDELGRLTEVTQGGSPAARLVYDTTGARILRQQNGATTIYVGDAELTLKGQSLSVIRYYTHQGQTIAARTANSNASVTGLIPDWQGTTHLQVNTTTGGLTIEWHDPYGQPLGKTGVGWIGERSFVGGTLDETGLTRIGARDYDPVLGTFITTDPIRSTQNRMMMNAYGYSGSNPTTYSDPTGRTMYIADCPGCLSGIRPPVQGPPAPPPAPTPRATELPVAPSPVYGPPVPPPLTVPPVLPVVVVPPVCEVPAAIPPIVVAGQFASRVLDKIFEDLDKWSLVQISDRQKKMIEDKLATVKQRSKALNDVMRGNFEKDKKELVAEWVAQAGQVWPDIVGVVVAVHHIIPLKNGGANEWWNIAPVLHSHSETLHGKVSALRKYLPYTGVPGLIWYLLGPG
jgi:RHS repeat-associated protein